MMPMEAALTFLQCSTSSRKVPVFLRAPPPAISRTTLNSACCPAGVCARGPGRAGLLCPSPSDRQRAPLDGSHWRHEGRLDTALEQHPCPELTPASQHLTAATAAEHLGHLRPGGAAGGGRRRRGGPGPGGDGGREHRDGGARLRHRGRLRRGRLRPTRAPPPRPGRAGGKSARCRVQASFLPPEEGRRPAVQGARPSRRQPRPLPRDFFRLPYPLTPPPVRPWRRTGAATRTRTTAPPGAVGVPRGSGD